MIHERSPSHDHPQSPRPCDRRRCARTRTRIMRASDPSRCRSASEKWERASNESGYSDAFERANELYLPIYELAKRASKAPLRTLEGTPVKAMATLVEMDCIDIIEAIPAASAWALLEIAQLGGFAAPPWMKRKARMAVLP